MVRTIVAKSEMPGNPGYILFVYCISDDIEVCKVGFVGEVDEPQKRFDCVLDHGSEIPLSAGKRIVFGYEHVCKKCFFKMTHVADDPDHPDIECWECAKCNYHEILGKEK